MMSCLTFLTVRFSLLHVEGLVPDGTLAGSALETLNMVSHLQGMHDLLMRQEKARQFFYFQLSWCCWSTERLHPYVWNSCLIQMSQDYKMLECFWFWLCFIRWCSSYPCDLLFALGTVGCVSVIVALGTENRSSLLEEPPLLQDGLTLWACELLRVPRTSECYQVPTPMKHKPKHTHTHIDDTSFFHLFCSFCEMWKEFDTSIWKGSSGMSPLDEKQLICLLATVTRIELRSLWNVWNEISII